MKKIVATLLIIFVVTLSGCSSVEKTILQSLNEEIEKQNGCNSENEKLSELMKQENEIYDQIIEKGTESYSEISDLVTQGQTNIESSKTILSTYEICVKDSIKDKDKLEEAADKIKDASIKNETLALLTEYQVYQDSLINYIEALKLLNASQANFYQNINENTPIKDIELLVFDINEDIENTNTVSAEHKDSLTRFNTMYTEYFEKYSK